MYLESIRDCLPLIAKHLNKTSSFRCEIHIYRDIASISLSSKFLKNYLAEEMIKKMKSKREILKNSYINVQEVSKFYLLLPHERNKIKKKLKKNYYNTKCLEYYYLPEVIDECLKKFKSISNWKVMYKETTEYNIYYELLIYFKIYKTLPENITNFIKDTIFYYKYTSYKEIFYKIKLKEILKNGNYDFNDVRIKAYDEATSTWLLSHSKPYKAIENVIEDLTEETQKRILDFFY